MCLLMAVCCLSVSIRYAMWFFVRLVGGVVVLVVVFSAQHRRYTTICNHNFFVACNLNGR